MMLDDFRGSLSSKSCLCIKGDDGYETARCLRSCGGARIADQHPAMILLAGTEEDVVSAIKYSAGAGLPISVRSGGGNWNCVSLKNDTLLIDVGGLQHSALDAANCSVKVGPGVSGVDLMEHLQPADLWFPVGHCPNVKLGGYLLGGGLGVGGEVVGYAHKHIIGLRIVTPDGDILDCDADNHSEYLFLAQGGYYNMRGVITSYTLQVFPSPGHLTRQVSFFPLSGLSQLIQWVERIKDVGSEDQWDGSGSVMVEEALVITLSPPHIREAAGEAHKRCVVLSLWAFGDTIERAEKSLQLFGQPPVEPLAPSDRVPSSTVLEMVKSFGPYYPGPSARYSVDFCCHDRDAAKLNGKPIDWDIVAPAMTSAFEAVEGALPMSHVLILSSSPRAMPQSAGAFGSAAFTLSTAVAVYLQYEDSTYGKLYDEHVQNIITPFRSFSKDATYTQTVEGLPPTLTDCEANVRDWDAVSSRFFGPECWRKIKDMQSACDPHGRWSKNVTQKV